ncbi:MAG: carboxylating nicotinate-nucleotide diphosphorylase [Pseudomonadota bacterium]
MNDGMAPHLSPILIRAAVERALEEDLGRAGDITSDATIPASAIANCVINAREAGIVSGLHVVTAAFAATDPKTSVVVKKSDGDRISAGDTIAEISGSARAILSAERTALNFLMRMSGIATYTSVFSGMIAHTNAKVCCTRKTIPGLRAFDKYAVKCGGGSNHRYGLDDAILIKDNHIAVAGGVGLAIERAKAFAGHLVKIEVEVDTLEQFDEALTQKPDVVLLDNMTNEMLCDAVARNQKDNNGAVKLEASGNVNIETIQKIAETGVDYISTSKITMAAPTLDVGLDIKIS